MKTYPVDSKENDDPVIASFPTFVLKQTFYQRNVQVSKVA